jgi:prevent-host-death family protein
MPGDIWKLQDAKAKFSEVVRRARTGAPQQVTVHGKRAVAVVDIDRFDVTAKREKPADETMAGFIERSRKYRGLLEGIKFDRRTHLVFRDKQEELFGKEDQEPTRRSKKVGSRGR